MAKDPQRTMEPACFAEIRKRLTHLPDAEEDKKRLEQSLKQDKYRLNAVKNAVIAGLGFVVGSELVNYGKNKEIDALKKDNDTAIKQQQDEINRLQIRLGERTPDSNVNHPDIDKATRKSMTKE